MSNRPLFLLTLLIGLHVAGATVARDKQKRPKNGLTDVQRADITYVYFNANKEKILGNMNTAAELFSEVLRKDPGNAAAMYELSRVYTAQNKHADALFFGKGAYNSDNTNSWYAINYAEVLQRNNKFEESAKVYELLVKGNPTQEEFYQRLAEAYVYSGDYEDAIGVYDRMDKQFGISGETAVIKARLYQQLKKTDKAIDELKRFLQREPRETEVYSMLAELYKSSGQNDKALETLKKAEEMDPTNPGVQLSLADFYREIGEKEKSLEQLKKAFRNPELDIETKISILGSYFALLESFPELKEQAHDMCRLMISTHGTDPRSYGVYGDFLSLDKQYDSARVQYRTAKQLGSDDFQVYNQLLYLDSRLDDWKSLLKDSEDALSLFPDQPMAYLYSGLAKHHEGMEKEAAEVLSSGLALVVDNEQVEALFHSTLGEVYHELGDHARSDKSFEKALEIDPNDASVMNNYAYFLSLRSERLSKAEELSKKSIELEPGQASYEDTYGWIMFVMGKFTDAKLWIGRSLEHGGESSAAVLEHYGDVLFKTGDTSGALDYWQRAKSAGEGASELLDKKILEKKYLE